MQQKQTRHGVTAPCLDIRWKSRLSERLDLHLAELDDARSVLQCDPSLRMLGILGAVDGSGAVERHGELRTLGDDLVGIPFVGGLEHGRRLGHVDDRAGAVARVGALVEDVHFVGVLRGDLGRVGAANEDAAVGFGVDPELGADLEILVGVLRNEKAVALVGDDEAVGDLPVGVADRREVVEVLAVEQRNPTGIRLAGRLRRMPKCGTACEQERNDDG